MSQMKEQNKTPEKELNTMETCNWLDAEFKMLTIRMLSELSENFNNTQKSMETINAVKEAGIQINDWEHKEGINIQPEQKEETRIQKKKRIAQEDSGTSPNMPTSKL